MTPLPILDLSVSCQDCNGACCRTIGTPPGWGVLLALDTNDEEERRKAWKLVWPDDKPILEAMSEEVKQSVLDYYDALDRGEVPDREALGLPCFWLDETTNRCRFYAHRPSICRDYEMGGESCREAREGQTLIVG